ncbi:hypothetical protein FRC17_001519 [Serendipita sp. 399]|nr:hypothetical protein FRC17_001519 [Serendipita sp. 399]
MTNRASPSDQEKLRQLIEELEEEGWQKAWELNVLPWEKLGAVQPPFRTLLQSDELNWPRKGRALVPGCGRGYDTVFIADTLGLDVLGLDISETAIQAAEALLASAPDLSPGKVTFREVDFLTMSVDEGPQFDLVYDYTFFVAIPPARRPEWGRQLNALVKQGGFLVTLIYPLNQPRVGGPPFFVEKSHYVEVLGENWERVIERTPDNSISSHVGLEYLVVWKKL